MNDYENYMKDLFKLSPVERFVFGKRDKECLSHIDNYLSDEYIEKEMKIIEKYEKTKDLELKLLLILERFGIENHLDYFLFSSYINFINDFEDDNETLYPKNAVYKRSREADFEELVRTSIIKAKEGLKMNMTYPKMIIKKFLEQIKNKGKWKFLYNFIKNHYYPKCRNEIGLCYVKNGKEIYKMMIKEHTGFLEITPEEIHKLGLSLIKKKKVVLGNTYTSREEMFEDCCHYAEYIHNEVIDRYFHYKPKKSFKIYKVSEKDEKNAPLGYFKPLEDKVFINLSFYNEISKNEVHSLIMHEYFHAYHFNFMRYYKLPKYKYYKYFNTSLVEGFAFYMETYCEDYDDDNNLMSLMRKLRLVVDTGINYYGWTYKKAFEYMRGYMPNKINDIKNEIDRYICNPAQAISYMIGKLHIIKLRDEFIGRGGNIKDFHHKLLMEGIATFMTIEKMIVK